MVYDLNNQLEKQQFLARATFLASKGGTVELTSKRPKTTSQNNYLHSIISYFALQYGDTADYCKTEYFKKLANPDLFWVEKENSIRGRYRTLRSTSELTQEDLSLAIERFKDWAGKTAGIYLPSPEDYAAMQQIEIEIQKNRRFL